jgi:hypothetical protein
VAGWGEGGGAPREALLQATVVMVATRIAVIQRACDGVISNRRPRDAGGAKLLELLRE